MPSKEEVLAAVDVRTEVEALLGKSKNGKYKCFRKEAHSNNDANPSLTMDVNGFWKCHTCGMGGDFFQLYMDVHGIGKQEFFHVLNKLGRKYGVNMDASITFQQNQKAYTKKRKKISPRTVSSIMTQPMVQIQRGPKGVHKWLDEHYGISRVTSKNFCLGWSLQHKRLLIPIPLMNVRDEKDELATLVNVRKHDIMRYHCTWSKLDSSGDIVRDESGSPVSSKARPEGVTSENGEWKDDEWKPVWGNSGGKVVGVKGHNSVYLYPMQAFNRNEDIWLVGGELKALTMIQQGLNGLTFTSGEGSYSRDLCKLFNGRTVRIVYDIDQAGQTGAMKVGEAIASCGGIVTIGTIPPQGLPSNGDITDYLRINKWDIACLELIRWSHVEVKMVKEPKLHADKKVIFESKGFIALTNGEMLGKYISVPAIISGRGTTPFAVPYRVAIDCPKGRNDQLARCKTCSLMKTGFQTPGFPKKVKLDGETVVDLTGIPKNKMERAVKEIVGIPPKCGFPKIKMDHSAVERIVLVPTVDVHDGDEEYRHHQVYHIDKGKDPPRENESYSVSGKVVGDPRNNMFTMAVLSAKPIDGNVFNYKHSNQEHFKLREALWTNCDTDIDVIKRLLSDLGHNVLFKYGVDDMVLVEIISWFMPFKFSIGNYVCHKVCPEVMILGDTRVGKSTTAKDLAIHYGAGRYVDCGANATFVGLVGGNSDLGSHRIFTWGVLPTSHRGHVTMDEANKLPLSVWGGLTNLKSSGIAERTTNTGARKTRSNVRLLTLCNPRSARSLLSYDTPLEAAIEVAGTPQDLARIDLLFVALGVKNKDILNKFHISKVPHDYTRALARYHLKWAWSLKPNHYKFVNPKYVLDTARKFSDDINHIMFVAAAESKFKIGRVAIAFACLTYSFDSNSYGVIIKNEHVDLAYNFMRKLYLEYLKNASVSTGVIPKSIKDLFNGVSNPKMLRILSTSDTWTNSDFLEIFGTESLGANFKFEAQLEHSLMTRRRGYFHPVDGFQDAIRDYVNQRLSRDE